MRGILKIFDVIYYKCSFSSWCKTIGRIMFVFQSSTKSYYYQTAALWVQHRERNWVNFQVLESILDYRKWDDSRWELYGITISNKLPVISNAQIFTKLNNDFLWNTTRHFRNFITYTLYKRPGNF